MTNQRALGNVAYLSIGVFLLNTSTLIMGWFDDWWESMRGSQTEDENMSMLTGFFIICLVIGGVVTGGTYELSGAGGLCCGLLLLVWPIGSFALLDWGEGSLTNSFDRKCRMIKIDGNVCGKKFTQNMPNMYGLRGGYVGFYCEDCRPKTPEQQEQQLFEESLSRLKSEWGEE